MKITNPEHMERVLRFVEERPGKLDMSSWAYGTIPEATQPGETACGAVCCIAGWGLILSEQYKPVIGTMHQITGVTKVGTNTTILSHNDNSLWINAAAELFGFESEALAREIFYAKPGIGTLEDNTDCQNAECDHDEHYDEITTFTDWVRQTLEMPIPVRA